MIIYKLTLQQKPQLTEAGQVAYNHKLRSLNHNTFSQTNPIHIKVESQRTTKLTVFTFETEISNFKKSTLEVIIKEKQPDTPLTFDFDSPTKTPFITDSHLVG